MSRRRSGGGTSGSSSLVAAGSVWETRMKSDEVKGGIKVFNGSAEEEGGGGGEGTAADTPAAKRIVKKGGSGKRKTWKSEGSTIQIPKLRSDSDKNCSEEQCVDAVVKKSPTQTTRKGKLSLSGDAIERSPIQMKKKGRTTEGGKEVVGGVASVDGIERRSPIQMRDRKSVV